MLIKLEKQLYLIRKLRLTTLAAEVIRRWQALSGNIERKARAGGPLSLM